MNKLKDKYTALFDDQAPFLAKELVSRSEKQSRNSLKDSFKGLINEYTLSPNYLPAGVKEVAKSTIAENVSLITTIPEEYFKNITGAVMRSITTGYGVSELKNYLTKFYGESSRKAKNVALDQTRKAYNNINKQRMMAAGLNSFEWIHSGGGLKPRQEHIELSGKIFSFDDLPVIVPSTGEKGIPGQAINCGCTMRPVYTFPEGEE
jgi:SPP1 gp7 family putative phage head morphogenesis protein